MVDSTWSSWIYPLVYVLVLLRVRGSTVNITYVESAVEKGAVCLDGSPPAYHLSPGFDSGVNNWLVHIEGGGWCNNVTTCLDRKNTRLGSSRQMEKQWNFSAILSNNESSNPDFYNWNTVMIRYCDGSSFTGDVESVDPATNLHYRGARIWRAVMEDLLAKGMSKAENALLSGCSAGGLASILHCDRFRALFQEGARVKCFSDAGYFINGKDITGKEYIKAFYNDVVTTHGSENYLPSSCTSRLGPGMCFFPQYIAPLIETPLFLLNPAYDTWQIGNILVPQTADPNGTWSRCKGDIRQCSSTQLHILQDFRDEFLNALASLETSSSRGMFINSCYAHCQSEAQDIWFGADSPVLENTFSPSQDCMVLAQKRNSHQNEGAVEGEILEEIEPIMQKFNARNSSGLCKSCAVEGEIVEETNKLPAARAKCNQTCGLHGLNKHQELFPNSFSGLVIGVCC